MCGIIGYVGSQAATGILMNGLRKLEYRGYDSAGIAVIEDGGDLKLLKREGKIDGLAQAVSSAQLTGSVGIGHTRWRRTVRRATSMPIRILIATET